MRVAIIDPDMLRSFSEMVGTTLPESFLDNPDCKIFGAEDLLDDVLWKSAGVEILCVHSLWFGTLRQAVDKIASIRKSMENPPQVIFYTGSVGAPNFTLPEWCVFATGGKFRQNILLAILKDDSLDGVYEVAKKYFE